MEQHLVLKKPFVCLVLKSIYFMFNYVYVSMCAYVHVSAGAEEAIGTGYPVKLKLQVVMSYLRKGPDRDQVLSTKGIHLPQRDKDRR